MTERCLLDDILAPGGLTVTFQPIFRRRQGGWYICAFEALSRGPRGTNVEDAEVLFEYVRRKGNEAVVDRKCVVNALTTGAQLNDGTRLGVNVHASTLEHDPEFVAFLRCVARKVAFNLSRLTIEIVEHSLCCGGPGLERTLKGLRRIGVCIAVDDIGLGHSNYRMLLECRPDFFKLDRYLVKGSNADAYRRAVLHSIAELAQKVGAHVVAEGVDNEADLDAVCAEGIEMVQGYLLSPPIAASSPLLPWGSTFVASCQQPLHSTDLRSKVQKPLPITERQDAYSRAFFP